MLTGLLGKSVASLNVCSEITNNVNSSIVEGREFISTVSKIVS